MLVLDECLVSGVFFKGRLYFPQVMQGGHFSNCFFFFLFPPLSSDTTPLLNGSSQDRMFETMAVEIEQLLGKVTPVIVLLLWHLESVTVQVSVMRVYKVLEWVIEKCF